MRSLDNSIKAAGEISEQIADLNLLHTPIGPLASNTLDIQALSKSILNSKTITEVENSPKLLVPSFLINQASRLLDFVNLVIRYKPEIIIRNETDQESKILIPCNLGKQNFLCRVESKKSSLVIWDTVVFQKLSDNQGLEFMPDQPYFKVRLLSNKQIIKPSYRFELRGSGLLDSILDKPDQMIRFEQSVGEDGQQVANLKLKQLGSKAVEYSSSSKRAKRAFPVPQDRFITMDQWNFSCAEQA